MIEYRKLFLCNAIYRILILTTLLMVGTGAGAQRPSIHSRSGVVLYAVGASEAEVRQSPLASDALTTDTAYGNPDRAYRASGFNHGTEADSERDEFGGRVRPIDVFPGFAATFSNRPIVSVMVMMLFLIVSVMSIYGIRHFIFTLSRLFGRQRHPYIDIDHWSWPMVTVLIPAHNEEKVIAGCIQALLDTNYPADRMKIVPVNDRSSDNTQDIIDEFCGRYPDRIAPFHRTLGKAGKSAALKDALPYVEGDIILVFDADYIPGKGLIKQLVAPFFDPEVGAVMGRVVPINASTNLLTRMLDLERSAGYQVDQQARMNMKLVPQFGGTVGGVRRSALEAVGGWHDDILAEDTDITYRLLFNGWKTVYTNRCECYEETPQDWATRIRQVQRWSKGHNQVLIRYWPQLFTSPFLSWRERMDGALLLFVFMLPILLLLGWAMVIALYFMNAGSIIGAMFPAFALIAYSTMGNFATFFEIAIAVVLDGNRNRVRLLPINLLCFFVSLFAITRASFNLLIDSALRRELIWDKTIRYRLPPEGI